MSFTDLIPAVSSAFTGAIAAKGQRDANKTNINLARENMAFQERMSNTSYQRAMHDMRTAGLNPMLAFMKGGATTPGGASTNVQNELGVGANSAMDMKRLMADYDKIRTDTRLSEAMIKRENATTAKTIQEAKRLGYDTEKSEFTGSVYGALNTVRDVIKEGKWRIRHEPLDADRPTDKRYFFDQVRVRRKGDK